MQKLGLKRIGRALRLDRSAYRELIDDRSATLSSFTVIFAVVLGRFSIDVVRARYMQWPIWPNAFLGMIAEAVVFVTSWIVLSGGIRWVFRRQVSFIGLGRALAVASAPGLLTLAAGAATLIAPGRERPILLALVVWRAATSITAVLATGLGILRTLAVTFVALFLAMAAMIAVTLMTTYLIGLMG